ncbi:VIT1/CCC1 transporter family protein [Candidatus Gottesmanbacteria bacterium]|nr:VIT1/CCC1 transporter family protein [Candidatus Gottesmanbacteria bacterium]
MRTRIDKARESYFKRDLESTKKAHDPDSIHESISHKEGHVTSFNLPEIILGGQDGLVNVLGVILGVAAATSDTRLVVIAGMAATFAESISMAAVAFTSKLAEADYYQSEYEREKWEIEHVPAGEKEEIKALYKHYGFSGKILDDIVEKITSNNDTWLKVMMEQELKLTPVDRKEAVPAAVIVGVAAIIGSFIPLTPFFLFDIKSAILVSLIISSLTLFIVGYYKAQKTLGRKFIRSGIEMLVIGMVSALVGYFVGSLFKI